MSIEDVSAPIEAYNRPDNCQTVSYHRFLPAKIGKINLILCIHTLNQFKRVLDDFTCFWLRFAGKVNGTVTAFGGRIAGPTDCRLVVVIQVSGVTIRRFWIVLVQKF